MTTTIGSLDLNAFSDLYSDSNQYFWFEGNASATYGAGVHITLSPDTSFIANPTGQNILMNTDGISIRNGLLPMMTLDNDSLDFNMVDIDTGTLSNAATFGARTRVGRLGTGYSKILIDSTSIESGIANIFQIVAKNDTDVIDIILDDDHTSDSVEVNKQLSNIYNMFRVDSLSSTSFSSASESYTLSEVASISEGNDFSLVINVRCTTNNAAQEVIQNYSFFTFVKGTSSTVTDSQDVMSFNNVKLGEYNMTVQYVSPATFSVTISAKKTTVSYAPTYMQVSLYTLSYMSDLELVPIQRYNGDLLFNAVHGRSYLGLDVVLAGGSAVNGSDAELYNSILSLGWQDTLGGIFLSSPDYFGIYDVIYVHVGNSVTIVAEVNYADTDIVWESSDTSVATVTPYGTDSVHINGVGIGACEITVSTSFMNKVFSESLSVRVLR